MVVSVYVKQNRKTVNQFSAHLTPCYTESWDVHQLMLPHSMQGCTVLQSGALLCSLGVVVGNDLEDLKKKKIDDNIYKIRIIINERSRVIRSSVTEVLMFNLLIYNVRVF